MDNKKVSGKNISALSILFVLAASSLAPIYSLSQPGVTYAQSPNSHEVSIVSGSSDPKNGNFYDPTGVIIEVGDKVMWKNNDISIHNLASGTPEDGQTDEFESWIIQAGGTFEHTFDNAGSIDYYCTIHPWMTGSVTVI